MSQTAARYDRWKAPAEDGRILLWPDPRTLEADARQAHEKFGRTGAARLQNISLNEVRRAMRKWVGHDDDQPLIATGHQTELYHPGVWAKDILIGIAAAKLGGRAVHFAVDTDEPKHLLLRWPGGSVPLTDDPQIGRDAWSGRVAPPTAAHLEYVTQAFGNAASRWRFVPTAADLLPTLQRLSVESKDLPSMLAASLHELDRSLGLEYDWMLVSPITSAEPYLLMAHHILAQADRFVADYNAALEEYRRQNRIKNAGRPMPNLRVSADECEVPFWLDSLADGTRL